MIKQGLKNYFKSLKYFFTPLGTMFLGMMLGFSILIPGIFSAVNELVGGVKELAGSVNLDFNVLFDEVWAEVMRLDWNNPLQAFETIFSSEWINSVLTEVLNSILGTDFETFKTQIVMLVSVFTSELIAYAFIFLVFWLLGFLFGYFLLKILIRRSVARRSLWKFLLSYFVNAFVTTLLIVLLGVFFGMWKGSIYISSVVALLFFTASEFLQAYFLYAFKKVRLRSIINVQNVGGYLLTNLLIFVISVLITLIAVSINAITGVFVGLALVVIALIVMGLNAESYVISVVQRAGTPPEALPPIAAEEQEDAPTDGQPQPDGEAALTTSENQAAAENDEPSEK